MSGTGPRRSHCEHEKAYACCFVWEGLVLHDILDIQYKECSIAYDEEQEHMKVHVIWNHFGPPNCA